MQCRNPKSYTHSNIGGFVIVLEVCKNANPQPAIVWASSSSVYGLNTEVPFTEEDRTDPIRCNEESRLLKRVQEVVGRKKGVAQFRIFDLGNTSPVPVSELVSILEKLLKVKVKAIRRVMKLPRIGDVPFTHANISLAQREFGERRVINEAQYNTLMQKVVSLFLNSCFF
ncbi:putative UDP-glucuronate 4-epimerase [Helianthus anomalus]